MRLFKTTAVSEIKLSETKEVPTKIQIFKVGEFSHPTLKKFKITSAMLSEFKKNFDERVRGVDIAFDYFHDNHKEASAWVEGLELGEDQNSLWAKVAWTPTAEQKIANKELRYFSPEFAFKWTDPESGKSFNNVLLGGGLTNRPFLKEMQAILAEDLQGETYMNELEKAQADLKTAEAKIVKLSEDVVAKDKQLADVAPKADRAAELEKQIAALQAELEKEKQAGAAMAEEKKKSDEAAKLAEKEKQFAVLLSEGKAVAAQKDAWIAGDVIKFAELQGKVNLKPGGHSFTEDASADDKAVLKLSEEKMKANPGMRKGEAIAAARADLKKQN